MRACHPGLKMSLELPPDGPLRLAQSNLVLWLLALPGLVILIGVAPAPSHSVEVFTELGPRHLQEFFQLIFRDLFDAGYGMFVLDNDTRTYWLRASDIDMRTEFQLVGTMLALAVYNAHTLDVAFPMALWRCAPP